MQIVHTAAFLLCYRTTQFWTKQWTSMSRKGRDLHRCRDLHGASQDTIEERQAGFAAGTY